MQIQTMPMAQTETATAETQPAMTYGDMSLTTCSGARDWIVGAANSWLDRHDDPESDDPADTVLRVRLTKLTQEG